LEHLDEVGKDGNTLLTGKNKLASNRLTSLDLACISACGSNDQGRPGFSIWLDADRVAAYESIGSTVG